MTAAPSLRAATPADDAFLRDLFPTETTASAKHSEDRIILLPDGTPAGRVRLEHHATYDHIADITIAAAHQRKGIATVILRELQRHARNRGIDLTLTVPRGAPALRLFARHGFHELSNDQPSIEMRWQAPHREAEVRDTAARIIAFLREIGLVVELTPVPYSSFLPGLELIPGGLKVDLDRVLYPGDILHEAGHLAALTPADRMSASPTPQDGDEAIAMAWSYAAAVHLGLPSHIVFHDCGYRGHAPMLRENFDAGNYIGLPLLAWMQLTSPATPEAPSIYPRMLHWLRESGDTSLDAP